MENTEPKKVDALTLQEAKDQISYKLYKTDYKYLSLDVCKVAVLEEAAKLYARSKWNQACEEQRICCEKSAGIDNEGEIIVGILSAPKPEFKP